MFRPIALYTMMDEERQTFFCLLSLRVTDQLLVTALKSDKPPIQSALLFHNRLLFLYWNIWWRRSLNTQYITSINILKSIYAQSFTLYFLRFTVGVLSQPLLPHCQITFQKACCLPCKSWAILQQDYRYPQCWSCTWNPDINQIKYLYFVLQGFQSPLFGWKFLLNWAS